MTSRSMPSSSMICFKAMAQHLRNLSNIEKVIMHTWKVNPNVIHVEDLEFADYVIMSLTVGSQVEAHHIPDLGSTRGGTTMRA